MEPVDSASKTHNLDLIYTRWRNAREEEAGKERISRMGFAVLAFMILSFSYELPLVNLTRYDRLNPRLFDVASVLLVLYWLFAGRVSGWRLTWRNPVVKSWLIVCLFFGLATASSRLWIPADKYPYSVFFYLKYLESMVVILLTAAAPWDEEARRKALWVALVGAQWVCLYAILQYFNIVSTHRYLPTGEMIIMFEKGIYSTLGNTYFHLGMYSVLCFLIGLTLIMSSTGLAKLFSIVMTALCVVPAVLSGSKAGFLGLLISSILIVTEKQYRRIMGIAVVILCVGVGIYLYQTSVTRERIETGHGGTPMQRLMSGPLTLMEAYREHGVRLLLVGGGFYVVPIGGKYRIGYGNHNIFLFPLEQAGVGGFLAGLWLWFSLRRGLIRASREGQGKLPVLNSLASAMKVFLYCLMIVGIAGQVFYFGFGTEHLTDYILVMFLIATTNGIVERGSERISVRG